MRDFTRRQVRDRERLFNPENTNWLEDIDRRDNWDYLITTIGIFGAAIAIFVLCIFGWTFWGIIGWPM